MLYGTGAPATYPVGGLVAAAGAAVSVADDNLATINATFAKVEAAGGEPNGIIAGSKLAGDLRSLTTAQGVPLYAASVAGPVEKTLYGLNVATTKVWDPAVGDMLVGDFDYAIVGIRQDLTWDLSRDGVVANDAGVVTKSAFQDDVTLIRMYTRVAFALGTIVPAAGGAGVSPFAIGKFATTP
jgi:HK97 family phage major capsid protein